MKIITGKYRGRNLVTPDGMNTRPTTGKIKESIFNIIQFDIEGRDVLDLFAGSGQMGLEALSRGAKSCVFCDTDRKAVKAIGDNINACKAQDECRVYNRDGLSFLSSAGKNSFGLIFLDPPYALGLMDEAIKLITSVDILQDGGIILCESGKDWKVPFLPAPYRAVKEYQYGLTKITTITKGDI